MALRKDAKLVLRRKNKEGVVAIAKNMAQYARRLADKHVDTKRLRKSIGYRQDGSDVIFGIDELKAPHAVYLELGFKPRVVARQYISGWAARHGVKVGKKGLLVGGPNSSLQHGPGLRTLGGRSEFLKSGEVGYPIIQPTRKKYFGRLYWFKFFFNGWRNG